MSKGSDTFVTGSGQDAMAAAQRFLELAADLDETPELRELTVGVTVMWLQSRAALDPTDPDLPAACEEVYERYHDDDAPEATLAAVVALCTRIHLSLEHVRKSRRRRTRHGWRGCTALVRLWSTAALRPTSC